MSAVAERKPDTLPAEVEPRQPVTILDIIERAAFDPAVDADKVSKLLEMARTVKADDARAAYTRDMIKLKAELPVIDRKGRIEVRAKTASGERDGKLQQSTSFARWEDIDAAITPTLSKHGFALTFRTGTLPDGKITVTAILSHTEGHSEESTMALPLDTSGSKNNVQAAGSSTSYGKRYTATSLLNIRTKDEDDDGKAGGDPGKITEEQFQTIMDLIERSEADPEKFCKHMKIDAIKDLPHSRYSDAIRALNTKLSRKPVIGQDDASY